MAQQSVHYAELHCLSNFTFLRGASHPQELVSRAIEQQYDAIAITRILTVLPSTREVAVSADGHVDEVPLACLGPVFRIATRARDRATWTFQIVRPRRDVSYFLTFQDDIHVLFGSWIQERVGDEGRNLVTLVAPCERSNGHDRDQKRERKEVRQKSF